MGKDESKAESASVREQQFSHLSVVKHEYRGFTLNSRL